uniref:uncharacterized protein LOC105350198 n=1 Tax=Fragaria vesca subsp. vesca TaxID=101020 RepID=UPI0005CAD1FE|nr:PREDICTED: uncharacterized protein LOC105350198 [Fragaria vesca subsp. vesca]
MIQLLCFFMFSEITLIMLILFFETPLMELVKKVQDVFMRSFARVVFLLLLSIFLLMMIMPRLSLLCNIVLLPDVDQNHLCEAILAGAFLFLAFMIDRLQHYVGELCVRRKELSMADKRIKQLESERREVNDAEANSIAQGKQLLDENHVMKNQLGLLRARMNDLDTELGTRAKETITLCKRIKQQESELGTKMNETTTLCRKIKQLESELESKTKEITLLGTRVKQLEFELETKAEDNAPSQKNSNLRQRQKTMLQQLEFERKRETKENATSVVTQKTMLHHKRVDSLNQNNELEGPLADEFNRLLDGNETLKNLLRSLPWRLSH